MLTRTINNVFLAGLVLVDRVGYQYLARQGRRQLAVYRRARHLW